MISPHPPPTFFAIDYILRYVYISNSTSNFIRVPLSFCFRSDESRQEVKFTVCESFAYFSYLSVTCTTRKRKKFFRYKFSLTARIFASHGALAKKKEPRLYMLDGEKRGKPTWRKEKKSKMRKKVCFF